MMKYKIGDKIKITKDRSLLYHIGDIGVIDVVDEEDKRPILVTFDDNNPRWVYEGEFEVITPPKYKFKVGDSVTCCRAGKTFTGKIMEYDSLIGKFKVGDRVELIDSHDYSMDKGDKGTITLKGISLGNGEIVSVKWDNNCCILGCLEDRLKKIDLDNYQTEEIYKEGMTIQHDNGLLFNIDSVNEYDYTLISILNGKASGRVFKQMKNDMYAFSPVSIDYNPSEKMANWDNSNISLSDILQKLTLERSKSKEETKMKLKSIKKGNLVEAKKQVEQEKANAEVLFAKGRLIVAQDSIDEIDRQIKELEEYKIPHQEVIDLFSKKK